MSGSFTILEDLKTPLNQTSAKKRWLSRLLLKSPKILRPNSAITWHNWHRIGLVSEWYLEAGLFGMYFPTPDRYTLGASAGVAAAFFFLASSSCEEKPSKVSREEISRILDHTTVAFFSKSVYQGTRARSSQEAQKPHTLFSPSRPRSWTFVLPRSRPT